MMTLQEILNFIKVLQRLVENTNSSSLCECRIHNRLELINRCYPRTEGIDIQRLGLFQTLKVKDVFAVQPQPGNKSQIYIHNLFQELPHCHCPIQHFRGLNLMQRRKERVEFKTSAAKIYNITNTTEAGNVECSVFKLSFLYTCPHKYLEFSFTLQIQKQILHMLASPASQFKQFKVTLGNLREIFETNLAQILQEKQQFSKSHEQCNSRK